MSSMSKQKINFDRNLFDWDLKYIVSGQLNKPVAVTSGWPVLILNSMNSNGQVVFNNNDKSKADLFSAEVSDHFNFNNARIVNKNGITHVIAEYKEKYQAFNAIKKFPSDEINIGILIKETYGNDSYKTEIMSNISFIPGEFLCDPYLLCKQSKPMKSAALDWTGYENIWDYMVSKNWNYAIINPKNNSITEYNKKNTEIINQKLEKKWKSRATEIFNKLIAEAINSHSIEDEKQNNSTEYLIEFAFPKTR